MFPEVVKINLGEFEPRRRRALCVANFRSSRIKKAACSGGLFRAAFSVALFFALDGRFSRLFDAGLRDIVGRIV